jgi:hypothetical protein
VEPAVTLIEKSHEFDLFSQGLVRVRKLPVRRNQKKTDEDIQRLPEFRSQPSSRLRGIRGLNPRRPNEAPAEKEVSATRPGRRECPPQIRLSRMKVNSEARRFPKNV